MDLNHYVESLKKIIDSGKTFNIKFFIIDDDIEQKIETAISLLFEKFERPELPGVVYTCIKELMINGTKANLKRILFENNRLDIDDDDEYLKGMLDFRNALNENSYRTYLPDLRKRDYWVNVRFEYTPDGMRINVVNNAHISPLEDKRLREKLKKAMQYDNIAEFYMDQGDEIEGAGMGIALIVMLLKGIEIDPSLFRIGNTPDNSTFARIELPLTEDFVSVRELYKSK